MNTRRNLLILLSAAALAPHAVFAQSKKPPVVIGWLSWSSRDIGGERYRDVFKKEFATLGWKEGSNYILEMRFAEGRTDQLQVLAEELAAKKPALIIGAPTPPARAAANAAPTTPILVIGGDPVFGGLAKSYARPGGMVTGIASANTEFTVKFLELLLGAAPKLRRIGFLVDKNSAGFPLHMENVRRSIAQYNVEARIVEVAQLEDVEPALARLANEGMQGLVVVSAAGPLAVARPRIVKFAASQRWPVIGGVAWPDDGALLGYGADSSANLRRAAHLADRILKGAKPADMPVERPMSFELVLNMKTAKALGLTIPHEFGARVDRVIQ